MYIYSYIKRLKIPACYEYKHTHHTASFAVAPPTKSWSASVSNMTTLLLMVKTPLKVILTSMSKMGPYRRPRNPNLRLPQVETKKKMKRMTRTNTQ